MKKIVGYDKGLADNIQDLLNAVVIQAAEDFQDYSVKLMLNPQSKEWKKRKLEDKYLRLLELKKNEEQICSLDNPCYRHVLRMHFIDGLTWQVIAERLNVTERHAYYLSRKAHDELLTYTGG